MVTERVVRALCGLLLVALVGCGAAEPAHEPPALLQQTAVVVPTAQMPRATRPAPGPTATISPTLAATATPAEPLAAVVNGRAILLADYELQVAQYEEALLQQGLDPDTEEGQARLADLRREVLQSMIDQVLIDQAAVSLGIQISDEELEAQVQTDVAAGGGQEAFEAWLGSTGQTGDEYRAMVRQSLIVQRVFDRVTATVPDTAEQVHARHIQVATEAEALEIVRLLQEGQDWVAVARERSLDATTKDNGGDLGWFPRGLMAPELERAAFALRAGEISGVVAVGRGYHVVQTVEHAAARRLSSEALAGLKQVAFEQWLEQQRRAAAIDDYVGP